ncbi:hypothetical protein D6825_01385 [Candidatus Woesearchaeota archaeon]|nr:MAG: hypothetical protein D6825_01385 [Candidatus Woesearchaeota archaeon]
MSKGVWVLADIVYWFFYIPLTALVVIALVTFPQGMFKSVVQPQVLEAKIAEHRLFNKVSVFDPFLGSRKVVRDDFRQAASLYLSEKPFAYRMSYDGEEYVGNRDFFDVAEPLAPIKYQKFVSERQLMKDGRKVSVKLEQVYPYEYDFE